MADTKLSALTELAATPANDDEVYIRDVSEAAATESKRITTANLIDAKAVAAVEAAGLTLAAAKKIIYANDGLAQFGVLDGSAEMFGGVSASPDEVYIRPKDGNRVGKLIILPKGTQDSSHIGVSNDPDPENTGSFLMAVDGELASLQPTSVGTGTIPTVLGIKLNMRPFTNLAYGLGDANNWWKYIKAQGYHAISVLSDHQWSGTVSVDITAGENLVFGNHVYMKSDGKAWKSDADLAATMPIFGIAIATINADATGEVLTQGWIRDDSWSLTAGGIVYASVTPGQISGTAPVGSGDQVQVVGIAKTTALYHFNPGYELVEIS